MKEQVSVGEVIVPPGKERKLVYKEDWDRMQRIEYKIKLKIDDYKERHASIKKERWSNEYAKQEYLNKICYEFMMLEELLE